MKRKPDNTWYPRFIEVQRKFEISKEMKGTIVGSRFFERLSIPFDESRRISDYAKNRHSFLVDKG